MKTSLKLNLALFVSMAILAGCGGGGGDTPDSTPQATNNAATSLPNGNTTTPTTNPTNTTNVRDYTAPTVAANSKTMPSNGMIDVEPNAILSFEVSEPLLSASIHMTCNGQVVNGTTSVNATTVTFKPSVNYRSNANCSAIIDSKLTKDLAGNNFNSNPVVTNFTIKTMTCPVGLVANPIPSYNGISMVAVCNNLFVDPTIAKEKYSLFIEYMVSSTNIVKDFYGSLISPQTDIIICSTNECKDYFADNRNNNIAVYPNSRSGKFVSPRFTIILMSPEENNLHTMAHELSHVELATRTNSLPVIAWFNEGLATYISGQPNCTYDYGNAIDDLKKLDSQINWNNYISNNPTAQNVYCQARKEVAAWVAKNGKQATIDLIAKLGQGQSFYSLYPTMMTQ